MESLATALVLCKLLAPLTMHDSSVMPVILPATERLPVTTKTCIFILSNGMFFNLQFIGTLVEAAKLETEYIPVIMEDGFRFPTKALIQELQAFMLVQKLNVQVETLAELIKDIFKEIAIVFAPQDYSSTEELLKVKAGDVADRLLFQPLKKLRLLTFSDDESREVAKTDSLREVTKSESLLELASTKFERAPSLPERPVDVEPIEDTCV